uniref:3-dehydroquinate synthase n=1 Tax=Dictyoglomus thermophilum TaxID=14 RepID=A0A7C3MIV4_DICTH
MEELRIYLPDKREYPIYIGDDILKEKINELILPYSSYFVISHKFLINYYKNDFVNIKEDSYIFVPEGEKSKSFKEVIRIVRNMANLGADRKSVLLAFGGGVIGDLTGFVSSIYMRGIDYIQIPTTLLAQVDSSIGGKTGINIPEGKNLVGTFYHPRAVVIDVKTLETLPQREYISGIAEIVKYGLVMDYELFEYLERNYLDIKNRNKEKLIWIIKKSLECKKYVVERDEKESSLRMILNFGHTFGHAIEAKSKYKKYLHGEAVAIGMILATQLAYKLKMCDFSVYERLKRLLLNFGFVVNNPYKFEELIPFIQRDKKAFKGKLRFILPEKIGEVKIIDYLKEEDILRVMKEGDSYGI